MRTKAKNEQLDAQLIALVDALGDNAFYATLGAASKCLSGYESCLIVGFEFGERPKQLYDDLNVKQRAVSITPYFDGAYLLDPFFALFASSAPSGVYRLRDCAPDDFFNSEYYRTYYLQTGLVDETAMLMQLPERTCILVSIGNRARPPTDSIDMHDLQASLPILNALCRKHTQLLIRRKPESQHAPLSEPLEIAFRNFGKDYLSKREREVVQLILKGHSNKSIARLLNISIDTVKVYNKRFHTKLNVSSQAELFSLFLEAISTVPLALETDPLKHILGDAGAGLE